MSSSIYTKSISGFVSCLQVGKLRSSYTHRYILKKLRTTSLCINRTQSLWKTRQDDLSSIVIPVPVTPANNIDDFNVGEELSTKINKDDMLKKINEFLKEREIKSLAAENGLNPKLFQRAGISFRKFCLESEQLPVDLHIVFSDIVQGSGHVHDIFPYFLQHAKDIFPHLECTEDLERISNLKEPQEWYPNARKLSRKLIFHYGPTNSGKTYKALESFKKAKSGVYCSPLKLLSVEVFNEANKMGIPCDLVTGEERQFVLPDNTPANHVACTIEMLSLEKKYDVAVIDEIQMIRDPQRGWAWTRALLGVCAEEIHICGEASAINLVKDLAILCGEEVELDGHKRKTDELIIENKALGDLSNIQPGDCIVCFNKKDIYNVSLELERRGHECAVIYGSLPPGTKLAQAKRFNDPNHACKILVATDAIGMGLNLSIRRIIFYSITKPVVNEKGEKEIDTLSTSQALQIAGRAGRMNTQFQQGYVTTYKAEDLKILKNLMAERVEPIFEAGLHPEREQVELFSYHLPKVTLSNLIDIFICLCQMNKLYFMCDTEGFQCLAEMIQHIPLPIKVRYDFCCAPINRKHALVCTSFVKFAKQYSQNEPLTVEKLRKIARWSFDPPQNIEELDAQEAAFEVLHLYLWLAYRFPDLFPDSLDVRHIQEKLDETIQQGVFNIIRLLKARETDKTLDEQEHSVRRINKTIGHGRLATEVLKQGLITPEMLENLHKEWKAALEENETVNSRAKRSSKIYTRHKNK